ncbi:MAG: acyltransferase family protein [Pseudomonadales bacterium]
MSGSGLGYRPDVDGLRAVAVVPVILFHGGLAGFDGGFVGVDVFFVVSGYLITSIITAELDAGTFTLTGFYDRRVRRIFPALFLVLAVSSVAAFGVLVPEYLEDFGQSVMAAAFFVSNFFFYTESGYFDGPAELHPLLHTWSLAVEEQFYLLFPPLLMLAARWRLQRSAMLAALALASFAYGVWRLEDDASAAFYLLPSRFWELMLGALLATAPVPVIRSGLLAGGLAAAGLVMIGWAVATYDAAVAFPGVAALLPCLGTVLVIHGGRTANGISTLLGSAPLRGIGLLSYSLYLWHFPLFAFARHLIIRPFTVTEVAVLTAVTFVLSLATWRFVEQPFRARPRRIERGTVFRLAGAAMAVALGIGIFTDLSDGAPWRMNEAARSYLAASEDRDTACLRRGRGCELGPADGQPRFVVWGDSHASALLPAFRAVAGELGIPGKAVVQPGCPPLSGYRLQGANAQDCADAVRRGYEAALSPGVEQVYLASRWTMVLEESRYGFEGGEALVLLDAETGEQRGNALLLEQGLEETVASLSSAGREVVLIGPVPEVGWHVPHTLAQRARFGDRLTASAIEPDAAAFHRRNDRAIALLEAIAARFDARLMYPHEPLCGSDRCRVVLDGRPVYGDTDHLTITGAMQLVPLVRSGLERLTTDPDS